MSDDFFVNFIKVASRIVIGVPIGMATTAVGACASTLAKLPKGIVSAYKALYKETNIGPTLKTVLISPILVGAVLSPFAAFFGGLCFGAFRGCSVATEKNSSIVFETFTKSCNDVIKFNKKLIGNWINELWDYNPQPLPPGEKPYDISIIRGVLSLVFGLVSVLLFWPQFILATLSGILNWFGKVLSKVWGNGMPVIISPILTAIGFAGVIGVACFCLVASLGFSYVDGVYQCYTHNFEEAFEECNDHVKWYSKWML